MTHTLPHNYLDSLPTKRMASGVLMQNECGDILLVKPSYKPGWEIPGGVVERNESPEQAAKREVEEETGLIIESPLRLICVDYQHPTSERSESLQFLFDIPPLTRSQIDALKPHAQEIERLEFFGVEEALGKLGALLGARLRRGLLGQQQGCVYRDVNVE